MKHTVRHGMSAAGTVPLRMQTLLANEPPVPAAATASCKLSLSVFSETDNCTLPRDSSPALSAATAETSAACPGEFVVTCVTPVLRTKQDGDYVPPAWCKILGAQSRHVGIAGRVEGGKTDSSWTGPFNIGSCIGLWLDLFLTKVHKERSIPCTARCVHCGHCILNEIAKVPTPC